MHAHMCIRTYTHTHTHTYFLQQARNKEDLNEVQQRAWERGLQEIAQGRMRGIQQPRKLQVEIEGRLSAEGELTRLITAHPYRAVLPVSCLDTQFALRVAI